MREDVAYKMDQAIDAGDAASLGALLAQEPRLTGTPVPVARDWGEEMWLGLHRAAALGRDDLARLFLEAGASVDARTRFRTPMHARATPLLLAAGAGHEPVVGLLLAAGADPGLLDANHRDALGRAAEGGHAGVVRLLIDWGVTVDAVDDQGRTPLHWAIAGGHAEAALMLIEAGADVNHRCPKERGSPTPLARCVKMGGLMAGVRDRLIAAGAKEAG